MGTLRHYYLIYYSSGCLWRLSEIQAMVIANLQFSGRWTSLQFLKIFHPWSKRLHEFWLSGWESQVFNVSGVVKLLTPWWLLRSHVDHCPTRQFNGSLSESMFPGSMDSQRLPLDCLRTLMLPLEGTIFVNDLFCLSLQHSDPNSLQLGLPRETTIRFTISSTHACPLLQH